MIRINIPHKNCETYKKYIINLKNSNNTSRPLFYKKGFEVNIKHQDVNYVTHPFHISN